MADENRVQFGLSDCYYAVMTEAITNENITYTYGTPVPMPGAVSLTLDPQGEMTPFYADNIVFYNASANNGYEGTLELARFPDSFFTDVLGMTLTATGKVLQENSLTEPKKVALLYKIKGDADDQCYVLYNVTIARPGAGSSTLTETKTPQTQSAAISAPPRADGLVFGRTTAETPAATKNSWFTAVYQGD